MKTDKEWEARARELLDNARQGHNMESRIVGPRAARSVEAAVISAALQLGREMQADVLEHARDVLMPAAASHAADERAEEIARAIEADSSRCPHPWCESAEACLACLTRKTIVERTRKAITKPKTREQVLEEALRNIVKRGDDERARSNQFVIWDNNGPYMVAKRALEWNP